MLCVAVIGGIASGKSTVTQLFHSLGANIISADHIARTLTRKGQTHYQKMVDYFGEDILDAHQELNRKTLRNIITHDPKARIWLENLLHPAIRQAIAAEVNHCQSIYCMIEIPLLTNKQHYPYIQRVLLVEAPMNIQLQRLMARDQCDLISAKKILSIQADKALQTIVADDHIINDGCLKTLEAQVIALHHTYATRKD